ncbi:NAD(P)H:quinone oxidoreductase [Cohnella cholangitidis]|uniref:NAD(P)H:quinone oxidoreductase n=1 Tax=Cohnella cholangitidis TaxID=2598458 RepID=A0A7G5C635_9BACL|nr:NAD(P)H:quinone oxidoreductase [Cohnella cholangitidis]QMV44669.1 NAD(P)H:quinone oxidoreductase [Cohnella cholangitidis]
MAIKLAIVYYSSTGTNYALALAAQEAAAAQGAEVRLVRVAETAPSGALDSNPAWKAHHEATINVPVATLGDLDWADAILFGTPTRFGGGASQLRHFLDSTGGLWAQGKLTNKVVSAYTSAQNAHGGQEATILSLYTTFYHWGAIVVAPGYTDPILFKTGGNPYGTSATVDQQGRFDPVVLEAVKVQTKRIVDIADQLNKGQQA